MSDRVSVRETKRLSEVLSDSVGDTLCLGDVLTLAVRHCDKVVVRVCVTVVEKQVLDLEL